MITRRIGLFAGFLLLLLLHGSCSKQDASTTGVGESTCAPGQTQCGAACASVMTDAAHCGSCNSPCQAGTSCVGGACVCQAGWTDCGTGCIDPNSNAMHCGGCNAACAAPQVCSLGTCSDSCAAGLTACNGGCVDTLSDPTNCGACGQACAGGQTCSSGSCAGSATTTGSTGTSTTGAVAKAGTTSTSTTGGTPLVCATEPTAGEGGVVIDGCCVVACAYGDLTDADAAGTLDGWGWEQQAECVVLGSAPTVGAASCTPEPASDLPEPGDGFWFPAVGEPPGPKCVRPCDDPAADAVGAPDGDGWGWEYQDTCIVPGSRAAAEGIPCAVDSGDCTGNGYTIVSDGVETCVAPCQHGALTDVDDTCTADGDGWGWEQGAVCIVPGSASAPQDLCCTLAPIEGLPAAGTGYMADEDGSGIFGDTETEICMPACAAGTVAEDCAGWGYEDGLSCILPDSIAAAQLVPCVYEPLTTDPPPGDGWNGDYTTTFFGEVNCQSLDADDFGNTDLNVSACVGNGTITLNSENQTWFGALGDLSSFWEGGECTCPGGEAICIPGCPNDTCGRCYEVACNPGGTYFHPDDPNQDTHNGLCRTDQSVVVELIDACPHNHSNNTYWCTDQRPHHIDISCSAFTAISNGRQDIDNIGSLNVWVRPVDCSVGLGVKTIVR